MVEDITSRCAVVEGARKKITALISVTIPAEFCKQKKLSEGVFIDVC